MNWRVLHSDCVEAMRAMDSESVDAICTDPPYELGFMGKRWDATGIAYSVDLWREALRVLKPGGHLVAFGGTRTYHRMACAIEDAGFEVRDSLHWIYGSGFPKSLDVSKAIDAQDAVAEREARARRFQAWAIESGLTPRAIDDLTGTDMGHHLTTHPTQPAIPTERVFAPVRAHLFVVGIAVPEEIEALVRDRTVESENLAQRKVTRIAEMPVRPGFSGERYTEPGTVLHRYTQPHTDEAAAWQGWGTALKPAHEPIVLARKPLTGTVAANVLAHGTGALNVDGCRVGTTKRVPGSLPNVSGSAVAYGDGWPERREQDGQDPNIGRWPPNLLLTHDPRCNGVCAPGCPVAEMDRQSGELSSGMMTAGTTRSARSARSVCYGAMPDTATLQDTYGDSGGASRFFPVFRYVPKPARGERDAGLRDIDPRSGGDATDREDGSDGLRSPRAGAGRNGGARNHHPTVKPVALMEWLVRLVTPPGGTVLDPFLGSGTTGCAAVRLGFDFIGIEREGEYVDLATRRIALAENAPKAKPLGELERVEADPRQVSMFGSAPSSSRERAGEGG